jgi:hypothetical protein
MAQQYTGFWNRINAGLEAATAGDLGAASQIVRDILSDFEQGDVVLEGSRGAVLKSLINTYSLDVDGLDKIDDVTPATVPDVTIVPVVPTYFTPSESIKTTTLGPIDPNGRDGLSLVTSAKNRTENLLKALTTWLACPEISEVVIVDWGSDAPVRAAIDAAGFTDQRIRVVRVENEPRWILSYAFNIGFRVARYDRILKADADITLEPDFFAKNRLGPREFIAGNWRTAQEGQAFVNGFFYLHKSDVAGVGGFNEYITTYGWDDDDIYDRLEKFGAKRTDVDPTTVYHLEHSDAERIGGETGPALSALQEITNGTMYRIRRNRFLVNVMPYWSADRTLLPFDMKPQERSDIIMRRQGWMPCKVPAHVETDADFYALSEMTCWRLGQRVLELNPEQLHALVQRPFSELLALDVEVALARKTDQIIPVSPYLVVGIVPNALPLAGTSASQALEVLRKLAKQRGLSFVFSGPFVDTPLHSTHMDVVFIPDWQNISAPKTLDVAQLQAHNPFGVGDHATLKLDSDAVKDLLKLEADIASPMVNKNRARMYIDTQHGLGNRMRSMGSAAAIAEATDRELVVVWEPDHHCEGHLSDLYDYNGAVINETFVNDATRQGCHVYNYMEIEEGGLKDAPLDLSWSGDIYARAAYVLNAAPSNWTTENQFLRSLDPVAAVRDLVNSVRQPNDLSAHVRMAGGAQYEHLSYEAPDDNWTEEGHALTTQWREKSHFSHFLKRIDTLIAQGQADRIFLAADTPEAYAEFEAAYGDRVASLPRALYDRSAAQLQYALADALLLGTAPLLLGSTWSSFSEMAMRVSSREMKIEMSGTDF